MTANQNTTTDIYDKLKTLGITLPAVATPAAIYLPFMQTGKLILSAAPARCAAADAGRAGESAQAVGANADHGG